MRRAFVSVCLIAFGEMTTTCGGGSPTAPTQGPGQSLPQATVIREVGAVVTDDPVIGIVAATASRETFALVTTRNAAGQVAGVSGVVYTSPSRDNVTMYFGSDGRPTKAVFGQVVVLFSNYRSDAVDVSVRGSQGRVDAFKDVRVDPGLLSKLAAAMAAAPRLGGGERPALSLQVDTPSLGLLLFLQRMALALQLGACVSNSVLSLLSDGAALLLAVQACASAMVGVITNLAPNNPTAFSTDLLLALQECADFSLASLASCVSVLVTAAIAIERVAGSRQEPPDASGCGPMVVTPRFVQIGFQYAQFDIAVRPSCGGWTAFSNASWIRPPGYSSAPGPERYVTFTTECNPNRAPRTGTVIVAGQGVTVEQTAFNPTAPQCPATASPLPPMLPVGIADQRPAPNLDAAR